MKTYNEIAEIINESLYLDRYNEIASKENAGELANAIYIFRNEINEMFTNIAYELKQIFGYDSEGYEIDTFSTCIGNGEISTYFSVELNGKSFEIRVSDHSDYHAYGERKQVSLHDKNVNVDLLNELMDGLNGLK